MSDASKIHGHDEARPGPAVTAGWRGAGHVLVVDDEDAVRSLVAHSVERLGFSVTVATDGPQGISAFESDPALFRLAILDLKMPGIDGIEVLRTIRAIRPDIPVILMSGYYRNEPAAQAKSAAPTGFLHKPFTLAALNSKICSILGA